MAIVSLPSHTGTLDRHQQRREAGLPTLSVLCGSIGIGLHEARCWAEQRGRPIITLGDPQFESILEAWVDRVAAGRDLARDASAWLARHSAAVDLAARVERITPLELAALLDSIPTDASTSDAAAACRWLLERSIRDESIAGPGLPARLGEAFAGSDSAERGERAVLALRELIPTADDPVLLLAGSGAEPEPERAAWLESAAASLARLALWQPSLATILAIETDALDAYLRLAPESRAKALIRAGLIAVRGLGGDDIARRLDTEVPGATARLGGSVRRLAADGASDELVSLFLDAARSAAAAVDSRPDAGAQENDPARSAAERFLFERLESLPATAGLFSLNRTLDFPFGPSRAMEVDLLAHALGLAVEVDGYYHFLDADAYRRDRRKDMELQKQGYLVVRVLADDVVARLEDVLSIILDAVAFRGGRNNRQRGEAS